MMAATRAAPDTGLRISTSGVTFAAPPPRCVRRGRDRDPGRQPLVRPNQALYDISMDIPRQAGDGLHRPVRVRQVDAAALLQPHERPHRQRARDRAVSSSQGRDINAPGTDVIDVRRRVGMVFQKSNPLPKSIYENVVYGLRIAGIKDRADAGRRLRAVAARGGAVGRSEGPAALERRCRSRAGSSSACASRGRSPSSPRSS